MAGFSVVAIKATDFECRVSVAVSSRFSGEEREDSICSRA